MPSRLQKCFARVTGESSEENASVWHNIHECGAGVAMKI